MSQMNYFREMGPARKGSNTALILRGKDLRRHYGNTKQSTLLVADITLPSCVETIHL
jgi:hypothetical protein